MSIWDDSVWVGYALMTFTKFYRLFSLEPNRRKFDAMIANLPDIPARLSYFSRFPDENIRANYPANRMLIQRRKRFVTAELTKSSRIDCWLALLQPSQTQRQIDSSLNEFPIKIKTTFYFIFILIFRPHRTSTQNRVRLVKLSSTQTLCVYVQCRERKFDNSSSRTMSAPH